MKIRKQFIEMLESKGYEIKFDNEKDILIQHELTKAIKTDITCAIIFDERDSSFLRVFVPNFWAIESEKEHIRALKIINKINESGKLIKLSVTGNDDAVFKPACEENVLQVCIGVEILIPSSVSLKDIESLFTRIMDNIEEFICRFSGKMLLVSNIGENNFDKAEENGVLADEMIKKFINNKNEDGDGDGDEDGDIKKTAWYN